MKKQLINEVARMKRLAGLITESQYERLLKETQQFSIKDIVAGKARNNEENNSIEDYKEGMKVVPNMFYGSTDEVTENMGTVTGTSGGKVQYKKISGDDHAHAPADLIIITGQATTNEIFGFGKSKGNPNNLKVGDNVTYTASNGNDGYNGKYIVGKILSSDSNGATIGIYKDTGEPHTSMKPEQKKVSIYAKPAELKESNLSEYEDLGQGDDRNYDTKDHIYGTFKEWLQGLIERYKSLGATVSEIGVDVNNVTPEEFVKAMYKKGNGKRYDMQAPIDNPGRNVQQSYKAFSYQKPKIVAGQTLGKYGEWDMTAGKNGVGTVFSTSNTPKSPEVYTKSDNETDKRSGYDFDRSMEEAIKSDDMTITEAFGKAGIDLSSPCVTVDDSGYATEYMEAQEALDSLEMDRARAEEEDPNFNNQEGIGYEFPGQDINQGHGELMGDDEPETKGMNFKLSVTFSDASLTEIWQ